MPALYSLLSLRPGEGRLVGALLLHAVLLGAFRIFVDTAASTLFLVYFESSYLPYVYIVVAALVPLVGLVYHKLAGRIPFTRLILVNFTALLVSLIAFRAWLALGDPRWPAFAFYIWSFAIAVLISLEFWGLAGQLLNVEQSKRLFSLISLGELFAIIPIGTAMPALTQYLHTPDLLWAAAGVMLGLLVLLAWFIRAFGPQIVAGDDAEADETRPAKSNAGLGRLFQNSYTRGMMALMALLSLSYYILDANFFTLLQRRYPAEAELAQWIGLFYALDSVLILLANLVAGRVLTRFGVRLSLLILPGALIFGAVAIAAASALGVPLAIVFNLALATKLLESALNFSINGSATRVLYQPLPAEDRVQAQTVMESIIEPLAGGLAGAGLLLFEKLVGFEPMPLALAMILFVAPWFNAALWLGRDYSTALLQALGKRRLGGGAPLLNDGTSAELLWRKLVDPHPEVVIYALALLEEMDHPKLSAGLQQILTHPAPEARREALRRLERLKYQDACDAIRRCVETETDPTVRGAAVRTLLVLAEPESVEWATPFLEEPEAAVRGGAMVGLVQSGGLSGVMLVCEHLLRLIDSPFPTDRVIAVQVLGEVSGGSFDRSMVKLFHDPDPAVRRATLVAAGQIQSPRLWPHVVAALPSQEGQAAASALVAGGAAALPEIKKSLARAALPDPLHSHLIRVLGRIRGLEAIELLKVQLNTANGELRHQAIAALARCGYQASPEERHWVHQLLRDEGYLAARLLQTLTTVEDETPGDEQSRLTLLRRALQEELRRSRARVFFLLTFLYNPQAILRVQDNLTAGRPDKRAYALEALETLLSSEHKPLILSLADAWSPATQWQRLQALFPAPRLGREACLLELAQGDYAPWVRVCALYALANNLPRHSTFENAREDAHPIIRATARWLLAESSHGGEAMLSVIEKVMILKTVSIFAQTPDSILAELAGSLAEVDFKTGERLFSKNEIGTCMFIIVSGQVRVHDSGQVLRYVGEREIVGEMAVLDAEPRSADVTVEEDTLTLRLDQGALYELMADHVEVAQGIIRVLSQRLRLISRDVVELRNQSVRS